MSQKKMEAYKEAKKNVKQIRKKEKTGKILRWILGILIAAALIAASVFLIYYTNVIKPKQEADAAAAAAAENEETATDVTNIINSAAGDNASEPSDTSDAAVSEPVVIDAGNAEGTATDDAAATDAGTTETDGAAE